MNNLNPQQFRTQGVAAQDIPRRGWAAWADKDPHPHAVSDDDHPADYNLSPGKTWSLHEVLLESLHPDHAHTAECYRPGNPHESQHDVDPGGDDVELVHSMAKDAHRLPALVGTEHGGYFGGGHRTAAWREAGRKTVPMWKPDL